MIDEMCLNARIRTCPSEPPVFSFGCFILVFFRCFLLDCSGWVRYQPLIDWEEVTNRVNLPENIGKARQFRVTIRTSCTFPDGMNYL
jgi:hypothetical protein